MKHRLEPETMPRHDRGAAKNKLLSCLCEHLEDDNMRRVLGIRQNSPRPLRGALQRVPHNRAWKCRGAAGSPQEHMLWAHEEPKLLSATSGTATGPLEIASKNNMKWKARRLEGGVHRQFTSLKKRLLRR